MQTVESLRPTVSYEYPQAHNRLPKPAYRLGYQDFDGSRSNMSLQSAWVMSKQSTAIGIDHLD